MPQVINVSGLWVTIKLGIDRFYNLQVETKTLTQT